jgi:hypothetical protein
MLPLVLTCFFDVAETYLLVWVEQQAAGDQCCGGDGLLLHLDVVQIVGQLHRELLEVDGGGAMLSVIFDILVEINGL